MVLVSCLSDYEGGNTRLNLKATFKLSRVVTLSAFQGQHQVRTIRIFEPDRSSGGLAAGKQSQ